MRKKTVTGMIFLNAILLILAIMRLFLNRTGLIISIGVKATDFIMQTSWFILGAAFLTGNILLIVGLIKSAPRKKPAQPVLPLTLDKNKPMDPFAIRRELSRLQEQRPRLRELLAQGLMQLDSIDRKQEKLGEILERNDVQTMSEVVVTMDETEQALCKNLVKVINRATLWDPYEAELPAKAVIYQEHKSYIERKISANDNVLNLSDRLLSETVSYMDEKTDSSDSVLNLQTMTEVISSLRDINHKDD